ncbi:TetR/AcrR family transcriptional regulator [Geotoga petraea]|uniref:DNA-binding transcriptional regulator, AcrR family n=1 Tax=Geotoga petraea TaxID=28234 RepID=A0A1G6KZY8_9BACT|nr:TetR/AcrR family transcriptional regulator [Geotoga petraea]SDC36672.1 DNA-binding transcriptional regulator, AcrR family [Geotoga petraea]
MNNKEDKYKKIIEAAEKLFFENNYEEVSMSKIAKNAGIAKGTLYLYFSSKKDLYFSVVLKALDISVVLKALDIIEDIIKNNVSKAKNGLEKVVSMGKAYIEFSNNYPDYYSLIANYEGQKAKLSTEDPLVKLSYSKSEQLFDHLKKLIQLGIKDKSIREDIDPEKFAMVLWSQTTGLVQQVKLREVLFKNWSGAKPLDILNYYIEITQKTLQKTN